MRLILQYLNNGVVAGDVNNIVRCIITPPRRLPLDLGGSCWTLPRTNDVLHQGSRYAEQQQGDRIQPN